MPRIAPPLCAGLTVALGWMAVGAVPDAASAPQMDTAQNTATESVLPSLDWAALKQKYPRIVGWISIPSTSVSQPIVAAPAVDPDFFLTHNAQGDKDRRGAVALDAECRRDLLCEGPARNACILAHNNADGSMFAEVARYSDPIFAGEHRTICVQTPQKTTNYRVVFVEIADGTRPVKRCRFTDDDDWAAWLAERRAQAILDFGDKAPARLLTLGTCSYTTYRNERTLVYAVPHDDLD